MRETDAEIAAHYAGEAILERIGIALAAAGADPDAPAPDDLKGVDEFHIGGLAATEALLAPLDIRHATRVLDVGCGLGGTARHIAHTTGASVTGVDLTPAFVEAARRLSAMSGLASKTRFEVGSALDLPVQEASVDLATMVHVGMNVADKPALFAEVARVLAPGGRFALYDVMAGAAGEMAFPLPWASAPAHTFLAPPAAYRDAARQAGLRPVAERDRTGFALGFFDAVEARRAAGAMPAVGLHLVMGEAAAAKYANMIAAVRGGLCGPWEMVFAAPG